MQTLAAFRGAATGQLVFELARKVFDVDGTIVDGSDHRILLAELLPLDGDGNETPRSEEVRTVAAEIEQRTGWRVDLVDERFTTAAARRAVREMGGKPEERPGDIDALAATVLLQHVLGRAR